MDKQTLWIAFKNYYLRDTTQQRVRRNEFELCCELLSKIIIFVTRHNLLTAKHWRSSVVNCFQKLLSSWHDTTCNTVIITWNMLWIAFKNYYLRDTTQLTAGIFNTLRSCELLSKIIIFVTRHNLRFPIFTITVVVNCFQKLLSSWHDTTKTLRKPMKI